jgi:proteasome accessory factor B
VPVHVTDVAFGEELGYRIDRRDYELPDIDLTAEEVTALAVAVHLTGAEGVQLALTKLLARAPDPVPTGSTPPVQVRVAADAVDAVAAAVVTRTSLAFRYRAADGTVSDRIVDPYAVVQRRGSWYLVARDHRRDALRAFRLDRLQDGPRPHGEPGSFTTPGDLDVAAAVSGPEIAAVEVELAVDAASRWAVESRGGVDTGRRIDDRAVFRVGGIDPGRDLAWLLGLVPGARVLAPREVAERVTEQLRQVLLAHGVHPPEAAP